MRGRINQPKRRSNRFANEINETDETDQTNETDQMISEEVQDYVK